MSVCKISLTVGGGLLLLSLLGGCDQPAPRSAPHPKLAVKRDPIDIPTLVLYVYQDIEMAQDFEHHRSIFQHKEDDSVTFNRDGKEYRFANVHAYRGFIKYRRDSLLARGETFTDLDTTYQEHPVVTEGSGGTFTEVPN